MKGTVGFYTEQPKSKKRWHITADIEKKSTEALSPEQIKKWLIYCNYD